MLWWMGFRTRVQLPPGPLLTIKSNTLLLCSGVFDFRDSRQMCMQTCPLGSLFAGITNVQVFLFPDQNSVIGGIIIIFVNPVILIQGIPGVLKAYDFHMFCVKLLHTLCGFDQRNTSSFPDK